MDYLKKTQYQHGYRHAHTVPKDATITPDLKSTYYASQAHPYNHSPPEAVLKIEALV
jgi:hypothetical protein